MKTSFLAGSTLILVLSGFAFADEHPTFDEIDVNNDGVISADELAVVLPEIETHVTDPETVVTPADLQALMPELEFTDETNRYAPIGEEEYQMLVEALSDRSDRVVDISSS